jgi:hypothetical protein
MKRLHSTRILAVVLALASVDALACGETLFRVGQGVRYGSHVASRPAVVLLYARAGGAMAGNERALRKGLERAGHKVTVKSAGESLEPDAGARPYDVVIADLAEIGPITESVGGAAAGPAFVPVVSGSAEGEWRDRCPWCLRDDASIGKYLQAIDRVMEIRAK